MFILRFTVENHGSFRDEAELSFVERSLRTSVPADGEWANHVGNVAAIYGPNASGKSQFLDALKYFQTFVRNSATVWAEDKKIRRAPFRLDKASRRAPSSYVLDFVHRSTRYEYGFTVSDEHVEEEWLFSFPTGRKRVLFERSRDELVFGRSLKGGEAVIRQSTGPRELVMSKGALLRNSQLSNLHHQLVKHIDFASFGEMDRETRLRAFVSDLLAGSFELEDLRLVLRVADIGIAGAEVREEKTDAEVEKILRAIYRATHDNDEMDDDEVSKALAETTRALMFEHVGEGEEVFLLPSKVQSSGTLTWLSLAAPAISTLRYGGVFVVDELDASLHPQLAQVIIQMFKDPRTNPRHAQLLFTTHDTYFMSPSSDVKLAGEEVFFVEKGRDGASELFSLGDFSLRKDQNLSRRYLQGRYGAVPTVAPAFLASLVRLEEARHRDQHEELV